MIQSYHNVRYDWCSLTKGVGGRIFLISCVFKDYHVLCAVITVRCVIPVVCVTNDREGSETQIYRLPLIGIET